MSHTQTNLHEVVGVSISEEQTAPCRGIPGGHVRWQTYTFHMQDGSTYRCDAFLALEVAANAPRRFEPERRNLREQPSQSPATEY